MKVLACSLSSNRVFSTVAPWMAHSSAPPRIPATPIMWNGLSVQLWKPCRKSRKRKIAATPKLGAKNQLDWPKGYIKNTDTNTAIGAENAIAL